MIISRKRNGTYEGRCLKKCICIFGALSEQKWYWEFGRQGFIAIHKKHKWPFHIFQVGVQSFQANSSFKQKRNKIHSFLKNNIMNRNNQQLAPNHPKRLIHTQFCFHTPINSHIVSPCDTHTPKPVILSLHILFITDIKTAHSSEASDFLSVPESLSCS